MGNSESKNKNQWNTIENENNRLPGGPRIVRNASGSRGQLYEIELPKSKNIDRELQLYQRRKTSNSGHLVNVKDVEEKDEFFECAGPRKTVNVVTEYTPFRLTDHRNLSAEQSAYILDGSLSGFEQLKQQNKENFLINDKMIGADENGKIKVWENENFALNQLPELKRNNLTQQNMINQLFNCVQEHTTAEGYESIKRSVPLEEMKSFPQAKFGLKRFISTIPNYNEVNLGYSLLPKQLLKQKNIQNTIKPQQKKQVIRSQIIQRETARQPSSHSVNSMNVSPFPLQNPNQQIYQSRQKPVKNLQNSIISRSNSHHSKQMVNNKQVSQVPVTIKQERIPLFIRQRQEAKQQNKKEEQRKIIPNLNSKPNYSPLQTKNSQNIRFNGQPLQKNIQSSNPDLKNIKKREQNYQPQPPRFQQTKAPHQVTQRQNAFIPNHIQKQKRGSMNMKSPQNIMLSPNPRPSNEQKQILNYANTHQGYNIQLSKQNNQVINIPKVNFQKNLQNMQIKKQSQPPIQFIPQQQIPQNQKIHHQVQHNVNHKVHQVNKQIHQQPVIRLQPQTEIQKPSQIHTVLAPQVQVNKVQNIQVQQPLEQKKSQTNEVKNLINNEKTVGSQKVSEKVESQEKIENQSSEEIIKEKRREKSSTFEQRQQQIEENIKSEELIEECKVESEINPNQGKAPNFLKERQSSKKENVQNEKPSSKRQFISKTTQISIMPVKKTETEEDEVFDEYGNRPLTGIEQQYKQQFIDEERQQEEEQYFETDRFEQSNEIQTELKKEIQEEQEQFNYEKQQMRMVEEMGQKDRETNLQVRGYNVYEKGVNEQQKYENQQEYNEEQHNEEQEQFDREEYMRMREEQMQLRMQIERLEKEMQVQKNQQEQQQYVETKYIQNDNGLQVQETHYQQERREEGVQYREDIIREQIEEREDGIHIQETIEVKDRMVYNDGEQVTYQETIQTNIVKDSENHIVQTQQIRTAVQTDYEPNQGYKEVKNDYEKVSSLQYDTNNYNHNNYNSVTGNSHNSSSNSYINNLDYKSNLNNYSAINKTNNNEYNYKFKETKLPQFKQHFDYSSKYSSNNNSYTSFSSPSKSREHTDFNTLYAQFKPLDNQMNYGRSAQSFSYSTEKKLYNTDIVSNKVYEYESEKKIQTPPIHEQFEETQYKGGSVLYTTTTVQQPKEQKQFTGFLKTQKVYEEYHEENSQDTGNGVVHVEKGQVYQSSMEPFVDYTQIRT